MFARSKYQDQLADLSHITFFLLNERMITLTSRQELYLITAAIFRKYSLHQDTLDTNPASGVRGPKLALYDTIKERDVDAVPDTLITSPPLDSKGVGIKVM